MPTINVFHNPRPQGPRSIFGEHRDHTPVTKWHYEEFIPNGYLVINGVVQLKENEHEFVHRGMFMFLRLIMDDVDVVISTSVNDDGSVKSSVASIVEDPSV